MLAQVIVPTTGGEGPFPGVVAICVQLSVSDCGSKEHEVVDVVVTGAPESGVVVVTLE
jgi:hypothetical protein